MREKIRLAISPCPNDTFMFYYLIHRSDFSKKYDLDLAMLDIQELNELIKRGEVDFCKSSFGLIPSVLDKYGILPSGAALGHGCGPMLVSKNQSISKEELSVSKILVPGFDTSAFALLKSYLGEKPENAEACLFSDIMPKLAGDSADAGLIIHESRFTYSKLGLNCLVDLGDWWESEFELPIPLGAIAANRDLNAEIVADFAKALSESVQWAFSVNWKEEVDFAKFIHDNAKEFDADVLESHIKLYVNQESIQLSDKALLAIEKMFSELSSSEVARSEFLMGQKC